MRKIFNFQFSVFILILLIAGFFRFYRLNQVPPSPSLDEVSIGWNAYSILKTGRDEYGAKLPILLRAYDDWRPALYVYLVIPFVQLFGLSVLAVRFPSALLGTLTVLLVYYLVNELFCCFTIRGVHSDTSEEKLPFNNDSPRRSRQATPPRWPALPLIAAFLLAISPWHIYISRLGHEVNAGLFFSVLAVFLFLKAVRQKSGWRLINSGLVFVLSLYSYQSQKIFIPLMLVALGLIFKKQLWEFRKRVVLVCLFCFLLLLPILKASFSSQALIRFRGTSIFSHQPEVYQRSFLRTVRDYQKGDILGLIVDNWRIAIGSAVFRNYLSHFNPSWLFFNSGAEKHKIPGMGLLYLWELPFLLIGVYKLANGKFPKKGKLLIVSWILIAPLAAGITTEAPHAMRIFNVLPMPQILTAIGLAAAYSYFLKFKPEYLNIGAGGMFLFLLLSIGNLYHNYFVNFPNEQSASFQYALGRAIGYVSKVQSQYPKIIFSNQNHCYQSYMFFLFYTRYDPLLYLAQGGTVSGGYAQTHAFGKYEFRPINWEKEKKNRGVLYIGNVDDFAKETVPLQKFKSLSGKEAIEVAAID